MIYNRYQIYAKKGCQDCIKMQQLLNQHGIYEYQYHRIDKMHPDVFNRFKQHCFDKTGWEIIFLPIVIINHGIVAMGDFTYIGGYNDLVSHFQKTAKD